MIRKPYQSSDDGKYWDYNFRILGIRFNLSVEKTTGKLYITKDEDQEK